MKVYLDDEREAPHGWVRTRWPVDTIELLKTGEVTDLSLDHDLGDDERGTGYDVLFWIEEQVAMEGFVPPAMSVHSANSSARIKMEAGIRAIKRLVIVNSASVDVDGLVRDAKRGLAVPAALAAHLDIVQESARIIVAALGERYPTLSLDADAILFGAATHDIGKALHPEELSRPGHKHERAGYDWLVGLGFADRFARFTWSHGACDLHDLMLEDLLVILADKFWKGHRPEQVERDVIARISAQTGQSEWEVFAFVDELAAKAHVGVENV